VKPNAVAYRMAGSGETLTFRELDERSNRGAHLFRSLGLDAGDHVAILMENCLEFLEVAWAAQRCGLYYTAISRYLTFDEIAYIVADSGARVLVVSETTAGAAGPQAIASLAAGLRIFVGRGTVAGFDSWHDAARAHPAHPIANESAGIDMLYSSGTTGRPKGVKQPFTQKSIETLHPLLKIMMVDMLDVSSESVYLSPAPLYHAAPLRFAMVAAALGATTVIMEKFDAVEFLRLVETHGITHSQLVPTMFVRMLKLPDEVRNRYRLGSLRAAVHAAAPCPPDVKEAMIAWWGAILIEYYAGTEANGVTIIDSAQWSAHRGSVGRAIVGELKIVDDESGEELPPREIGSIYFANGLPFEYHNDPQKTRGAHNERGWSTLGDVGFLDEEGYLYLTDRKAYTVISGGVNVYPQETEDVMIGHPEVTDVAVFGVPNAEMGEEVKAVVQPADMSRAGPDLERRLIAYCRERLSAVKCPRSIDFASELPRTPTGKLIKRHLRDRYWQAGAEIAAATSKNAMAR
jgi:fatty-acyl-CoA synthase